MHAGRLCEMRGDGGWEGCGFFECVCAFMNFRQMPLSAGLWESAYSTERLLDCQCDRQWLYVARVGWSD